MNDTKIRPTTPREREMIAARTLPYLTDEEVELLRAKQTTRKYTWTRYGQHYEVDVVFAFSSASYITVYYDGQPLDCINIWDHAKGVPTVRNRKDFLRKVNEYWADKGTVRDMIRGGLGLPIGAGR